MTEQRQESHCQLPHNLSSAMGQPENKLNLQLLLCPRKLPLPAQALKWPQPLEQLLQLQQ
jgi:hypothetical protein